MQFKNVIQPNTTAYAAADTCSVYSTVLDTNLLGRILYLKHPPKCLKMDREKL